MGKRRRRKGDRRNRRRRAGGRGNIGPEAVEEDRVQKGESKMKMEGGGGAGEVIVI